ncbi:Tat proofreading chaperone DmsD [Laribacter hongkongensis]|uniref:Tat proofreading chaperone DmsD n=1 Tax=Laribacter hongkongensis TaxID=168471 RepID=UPI001EFEBB48|nr:Tat proofreading chaperone DmsD [Laribacter hongkongensis]MCG9095498.1 Tat proofreading chaperone DmsD [Laribacter hongkongensis]
MPQTRLESVAPAFRILGALFYQPPAALRDTGLTGFLASPDFPAGWPAGSPEQLEQLRAGFASAQATEHDAGLAREHQRLFVGPAALPAPPWGSVYLDEESVLFGDSTRALQAFAGRHGIALETGQREPLDHFGLVCWLVAHAAEASDEAAVHELLCEHLLPWSGRFLSLFEEASAGTPFYQAAAGLARLTLDALQTGWPVSVAARRLYR